MQVQEGARRNMRRADLHPDARGPIQHPGRHHDDHTGRRLNMNELTSAPSFTVKPPNTPPVQRMPAIMDFDFLPDMGRMNGRLCSIERTRSSPATIKGRRSGQPSPRLSRPANCMASIRKPTSPTCSQNSSISGQPRASTSSCPGPGRRGGPPIASRREPRARNGFALAPSKNQAVRAVGSENRLRCRKSAPQYIDRNRNWSKSLICRNRVGGYGTANRRRSQAI